ncbi:MAG: hypothetical protein V3V35_01755 [Dehalococcoidia bacterium]
MSKSQRVRIQPITVRHEPKPLPPAEEIIGKLGQHPEVEAIRARRFSNWLTTPLDGGLWTSWGNKARLSDMGLTYMAVNEVSTTPEPAEVGFRRLLHSRFIATNPAISREIEEILAPKYGTPRELEHKYEVWIDDAALLTEEALDRRWYPNRDLRWEEMQPLPQDLERAFDQFLTYLIQSQYFCSDVMGPWIGLVHYAFVELKSYLAYELFDYNTHSAVLRKRVLSNGGGMGVQVDGVEAGVLEVCNEASHGFEGEVDRDFNAMVFALDIVFNGLVLDILRLGEAAAPSPFDRGLLGHMVQDNARHVAWGCKRINYYLDHCPDREEAVVKLHLIADTIEPLQTEQHLLNPKVLEPLALLLGGGADQIEGGYETLRRFWPQFAARYLGRLDAIGLPRRDRCLIPTKAPF